MHLLGAAEQLADDFVAAIDQETPYAAVSKVIVDPAIEMEGTQQTIMMLFMLAFMAMVVSGFLIVNIINTVIVEQRQQIGVMKSLGATSMDNLLMYIGIALSYGAIGMVPGVHQFPFLFVFVHMKLCILDQPIDLLLGQTA